MEDPAAVEGSSEPAAVEGSSELSEGALGGFHRRKDKRKVLKKLKRKQIRKEAAIKEREEEEARSNDPEQQLRARLKEQQEAEIAERERKEFEERERLWLEAIAARKAEEEEERRKKLLEESQREKTEHANELEEGDEWDYVEEGPAEIIWQGNEIIVKKKRVKVTKKSAEPPPDKEDDARPTSNPLPPQSAAFASYKNGPSITAQEVLESVAQQIPNFGTEQDKAHCPFHLKTGACRFGSRCSRVHFYPDKSCTLLIKNMYNGPGLAWEQDEGLEYTDEEVERCYEEFYEDVHTEFLKFGELVNFKVCKNGSYHLRGNVYVHYKSLESAVIAYNTINGRYFAGKQITCEFVGVTRWKVAICGEYMKTRLKTCSHGTACNFIHCFRNPGGDYEWADWDDPPPKYWIKKMAVLFGPSDESGYGKQLELEDFERSRDSSRKKTPTHNRYWSRRSTYGEMDEHNSGFGREDLRGKRDRSHSVRREHSSNRRKEFLDKNEQSEENHKSAVHGYNVKYSSRSHDSGEDSSKEKEREFLKGREFLKKSQKSEENCFEDKERHTRKHKRTENFEVFSDEHRKSERKYKSESHKPHCEEHRPSDRLLDYPDDDNRERSYSRSSEEPYARHNIDAQERYNGRDCSNDLDSDRDLYDNRSWHSKQPNERRELDQYNSRRHTNHTSYDNEQDGNYGKLRKQEASNQRLSSDKSHDGWESTDRDSGREATRDCSLSNESGQSYRKHSRSDQKGKHHRENMEYKISNSDSDEELDRRVHKKHSRRQTHIRCSASSKERNQRNSHDS